MKVSLVGIGMDGAKTLTKEAQAVSYTHLDVYKRQSLLCIIKLFYFEQFNYSAVSFFCQHSRL